MFEYRPFVNCFPPQEQSHLPMVSRLPLIQVQRPLIEMHVACLHISVQAKTSKLKLREKL